MLLSVLWKYVCLTTDIMWLMSMRTTSKGPNCSDWKQRLSSSLSEGNNCLNQPPESFPMCCLPFSSPLTPFLQMNYSITPMGNSRLWLASCETSNWTHTCQLPKDMVFCNLLKRIVYISFSPPSFHQVLFFLLHSFRPIHLLPKHLPLSPLY